MEKKISITWNCIIYDKKSKIQKIEDILKERFCWEDIFEKTLEDLYDPYLLKDMDRAINRIKKAKKSHEKIIIFGDYDVDGVTSTSLLMHVFKTLDMQVSYRLPHRVHDGYGLKQKFIDELIPLWVTLIITVDCGSRDADIISRAKEQWIDIIVTDHHHVPDNIPNDAVAFINPNRPDCTYPFKYLAGAGVAFKLMMAIVEEYFDKKISKKYIREGVDVAALGTVADCMPLIGENRIIVREWLKQLKNSRSRWLRKLIEDKMMEDLDGDVFWFFIGPRINAAGRMDSAYKAVNLILNNSGSLEKTLREIEELNTLRKTKTLEFFSLAIHDVNPRDNIIIHSSQDIPHGVIGIVAGRLTERFFKPSIVLKQEQDKLIASCRSPAYFSIVDILEEFKEYFIAFGWHKQAAGFSISKEKFPEFRTKITRKLNSFDFSQYKKELQVDKSINLDEIGFKLLESMENFKPFWMGNTKPLFIAENFIPQKISFLWKGRDHIKFENPYGFKIFAFFMGEHYELIKRHLTWSWECRSIDLIFDISEDNWMGKKWLMLKVIDIVLS